MKTNYAINYIISLSLLCLYSEASLCQPFEKILSYNTDTLKYEPIVFMLSYSNIIFPDSTNKYYAADEVVISSDEQNKIELTNCSINEVWTNKIEDSAMKLIRCDTVLTNSTMNLSYSFMASEACKGCLVFYNNALSNQRTLAVEYTCNPVPSIEFNLTHQDWLVDTTEFSRSSIHLAGQTNVSKLKVETYGDGVIRAVSIYPKSDGSFSDTVCIAFSHVHGIVMKNNTRVAIYGAIGYPKILTIFNNVVSVNETTYSLVPKRYYLFQNYPDPFNPSTTISFTIPTRSSVSLRIFDLLGKEVSTIVSQELPAGTYSRQWNASKMSSGIYFYRLQAGSFTQTKRLVLLK